MSVCCIDTSALCSNGVLHTATVCTMRFPEGYTHLEETKAVNLSGTSSWHPNGHEKTDRLSQWSER
eukprot:scaffold1560_cov394-Pavlova_lutheri.AAC.3